MTISHDKLMHTASAVDPSNGTMVAIDNATGLPTIILQKKNAHVDYVNVITASILLYRVNANAEAFLETLIEVLEETGRDDLVNAVQEVCATLNTARRCAIDGIENMAALRK
jgi:hypothetical protein